jgi:DNA-binding NarL/FixJ family response regulator
VSATRSRPSRRLVVLLIGMWPIRFERVSACDADWLAVHRCASDLSELRRALVSVQPKWLVLGEGVAEETLWRLAAATARLAPDTCIAVTGPAEDIDRCESWLRRGALVYLAGPTSLTDLVTDLQFAIVRDRLVIDAQFQRILLRRQRAMLLDILDEGVDLTKREFEVLDLLCHGLRNAEIAAELHITNATVDFHVRHILTKLDARNRTQAADRARLLGLTGHLRKP